MLYYEAWDSTYRNYKNVANTPIAKQRLMILMLNIVFHLCCDMRPEGLRTGIIEKSRKTHC
jgi:succinate dehydrogenase/fumarate reductase cytochrome b subunit